MEKYALFFNCNIHTLNLCDYSIYFIAVNTLGGNFFLICRNWPDDLLSFARRGELSRDWRGVSPLHTPPGVPALGVPVRQVAHTKSLGTYIDDNLSWNAHIEKLSKKVASGISALKRIKPFASPNTMQLIYNCLV